MWREAEEMAMRPWGNAALALAMLGAAPALADGVVPSRDLPGAPRPSGAEQPVIRSFDGRARGFGDDGVARTPGGRAAGAVDPAPSGGGVVRKPDGRAIGDTDRDAGVPTFEPQRRDQ
jgi:hypothetical protein